MNSDGVTGADYACVVLLVCAAIGFLRSLRHRLYRQSDDEASEVLWKVDERADVVLPPRTSNPAVRKLVIAIFVLVGFLLIAAPIATVMVAQNAVKHQSSEYDNYAKP